MNDMHATNNVFSTTLPSLRSNGQLSGSDEEFCVSIQTLPTLDVIKNALVSSIYYSYNLIAYFYHKHAI